MLQKINGRIKFRLSGEAETGSAGEQPARNNLMTGINDLGMVSISLDNVFIPVNYALRKLIYFKFFFAGFVLFTLNQYSNDI